MMNKPEQKIKPIIQNGLLGPLKKKKTKQDLGTAQ